MKKLVLLAMAVIMLGTTFAEAQNRPGRPPWQDVCCGGPCCVKSKPPGR